MANVQTSVRSYVGIAKETTKGTPVAATDYIPVLLAKQKPVDVIAPLYDEGLRGSMVKNYNYVPGRTRSTFDFGGAMFPDTIGYMLGGIMGSVATTGASAPFTHTVSLLNSAAAATDAQPTSFTLTDFYSAAVRQFPGCQIHNFDLKWSAEGLVDFDAKATGWASATTTAPTPSFSTIIPVPTWQATVSVGGTQLSTNTEGSLALSRPVVPVYGVSATQNPYQIHVGALEARGTFKFVMEADTELVRFLTNTQPAITVNWANGTGATATQVQFTLTKGAYTAAVVDRGKEFVQVDVTFEGLGNTTDAGASGGYSPVKWVLQNAKTSGTYQ